MHGRPRLRAVDAAGLVSTRSSIHIVTFPRSISPALYSGQFRTRYTPFGPLVLRSSLRIFPPKKRESTQSDTKLTAVPFRLLRVNVTPTRSSRIYATTPMVIPRGYAYIQPQIVASLLVSARIMNFLINFIHV